MSLSECPGCGLPRESASDPAKPCPLCGWDPSKPVPTAPATAPTLKKPERTVEEEPSEAPPTPAASGRAILLLAFVMLFLGAGIGGLLVWLSGNDKPTEPGDKNDDTAQKANPEVQQPPVATPPNPKEKEKQPVVTPPEPPRPPVKVVAIAPEPHLKGLLPKPRPGFATARLLADDVIKIDGDLADWKDIPHLTLNALERGKPTKKVTTAPKVQKAYLAYCSKGVLVAAEVVDTSGELENVPKPEKGGWAFWDNDALEVFIDTINSRDPDRGAPHHHQFFAFPVGAKGDDTGGYESKIIRTAWSIAPLKGDAAITRAGRVANTGWTIEMLIPYSALRQGALKPGTTIGFELQLDTGTNLYYFWACDDPGMRISMHPHAWGEIALAGSDAKLELLDATGTPTLAPVPGAPLTMRLTDTDLALDSTKPAQPTVTVYTRAGAERTVALRETAPRSGVYVGTIATRPAPGVTPANLLELAASDALTVEYVEPLRANGDRDRVLRAEYTVAK